MFGKCCCISAIHDVASYPCLFFGNVTLLPGGPPRPLVPNLPVEPSPRADDATRSESLERLSESPTGDPAWRSRCVSVPPDASLLRAMTVMSEARTHRAYVASSPNSRPVGVVTLTDVMRIFAVDSTAEEGDAGLTW